MAPTQALISAGSSAASLGLGLASLFLSFSIIFGTTLSEHLTRLVQRLDQDIDLFDAYYTWRMRPGMSR